MAALLAAAALSVLGCAGTKCDYCESMPCEEGAASAWNVELLAAVADPCDGTVVRSLIAAFPPLLLVQAGRDSVYRITVPCVAGGECTGMKRIDVPVASVRRVTSVSDPRIPPRILRPEMACVNCERQRTGWWFFDKVELRAMGGHRGKQSAVLYPNDAGGTLYEPETFGFGRGGTTITVGAEAAVLWDVLRLNERDVLHLGALTGVWPADGSVFIPASFHPRLTFNNRPDPYGCSCNAWYVFGDAGLALDGQSGAPLSPLFEKRFFYGAGIGYEWVASKSADLAIDMFYRRIRLPLPSIDCCPGTPTDLRNPIRASHVIGLRIGLTF